MGQRGRHGESLERIVYFGWVGSPGRRGFDVVRVVREGGRQVEQRPTGRTFPKESEAACLVQRLNLLPPDRRAAVADWTPTAGYVF